MTCPECKSPNSKVTDSRHPDPFVIYRTRKCPTCGYKWRTYEIISDTKPKRFLAPNNEENER